MNTEKELTIDQAQAIGRAAAASQGLKPEDVAFMPKQPKQAKQPKTTKSEAVTAKPEPVSEPTPTPPSDSDLLTKKAQYDEARSKWARGDMNAQELEAFYASYMRSRGNYAAQQTIYGHSVPPENPLPKLGRNLEDARLARDDLQTKLREAKQEEATLKQEKATAPVRIAAVAVEALKILQDPGDNRSIPAISEKAAKAEDRVHAIENRMRVARREN